MFSELALINILYFVRSFRVDVTGMENINYYVAVSHLSEDIDPTQSYHKVLSGLQPKTFILMVKPLKPLFFSEKPLKTFIWDEKPLFSRKAVFQVKLIVKV